MISTKNLSELPDRSALRQQCKAISVLDAIFSQDWEFRYYSYNSEWSAEEEFFEMRDGEGDQVLILFPMEGCVINGFAHEFKQPKIAAVTKGLPDIFKEFIFGEPVASIGTTFCIWETGHNKWEIAEGAIQEDNSERLLSIFDGKPETYVEWATEYFEGSYVSTGISLDIVRKIYKGETLTKEMIYTLVDEIEDWEQLEDDMLEIGYPYEF